MDWFSRVFDEFYTASIDSLEASDKELASISASFTKMIGAFGWLGGGDANMGALIWDTARSGVVNGGQFNLGNIAQFGVAAINGWKFLVAEGVAAYGNQLFHPETGAMMPWGSAQDQVKAWRNAINAIEARRKSLQALIASFKRQQDDLRRACAKSERGK